MKHRKNAVLNILIIILTAVMLLSGYKLFNIGQEARENEQQYEELEQTVQIDNERRIISLTAAEKYQSVYDLNNDFVGWVYIPDTLLNYPVVQTPKKPEYYLRRDFQGKYSSYGVPFMDYRCVVDESDHILLYGHNMLNSTMFSAVEKYASKAFWQEHPYIGFDTMNGYGTYEVAISARIDLQTTDFRYTDYIDFSSKEEFDKYVAKAKKYRAYDTGVSLEYGDKLLLLSTCEYNYDNGRFIVIAKKISDDDLSTVTP